MGGRVRSTGFTRGYSNSTPSESVKTYIACPPSEQRAVNRLAHAWKIRTAGSSGVAQASRLHPDDPQKTRMQAGRLRYEKKACHAGVRQSWGGGFRATVRMLPVPVQSQMEMMGVSGAGSVWAGGVDTRVMPVSS